MEQLLDGQIRIERGGAAAPEQRSDREYTLSYRTAMKGRTEGMDGLAFRREYASSGSLLTLRYRPVIAAPFGYAERPTIAVGKSLDRGSFSPLQFAIHNSLRALIPFMGNANSSLRNASQSEGASEPSDRATGCTM